MQLNQLLVNGTLMSTEKELTELGEKTQRTYENKLSDWMAIEAIIRQRDRETAAENIANIARLAANKGQQVWTLHSISLLTFFQTENLPIFGSI